VLLVSYSERVGRVDRRLSLGARDLAQRLGDGTARDGDEQNFRLRGVAAVASELRHLVPRSAPEFRQAAADVPAADHRDLHGYLLALKMTSGLFARVARR
jgi:hypothetical protein